MQKFDTEKKLRELAKFCLIALLMFILKTCSLFGQYSMVGVYLAGLNYTFSLPLFIYYASLNMLLEFNTTTALTQVLPAFAGFVTFVLLKKHRHKFYYTIAIFLICSTTKLFYAENFEQILGIALYATLCFFFAVSIFLAFSAMQNLFYLKLEQSVSLCVLVVLITLAIIPFNVYNIFLAQPLILLAILVIHYVFSRERATLFALIVGIAYSIFYKNTIYLGYFAVLTLPLYVFSTRREIVYSLSVFLANVTIIFLFDLQYFNHIESIAISFMISILFSLASPLLKKIKDKNSQKEVLSKMLINKSRQSLSLKLEEISAVFYEMQEIYKGMITEKYTQQEKIELLCQEINQRICKNCQNKQCKSQPVKLTSAINFSLARAIDSGKITIANTPSHLHNCSNLSVMISIINQMAITYRAYMMQKKSLDESKKLLARQLGGISQIFYQLSGELAKNLSTDPVLNEKLIIHMQNYGITCLELLIFQGEVPQIAMVILNTDLTNGELVEIVGRFFNKKFIMEKTQDILGTTTKYVFFKLAPCFDVMFGIASEKKYNSNASGDAHALIKLSESKFLVALCDGMGSGDYAQKISSSSITLIENFYRANFSSPFILETVNSLLSTCFEESFSATDILICDLNECSADFIKLGSPPSYIVNSGTVNLIDGGSAPLGILDRIKPSTVSKKLTVGDNIVLVSDGITDAYKTDSELFEELTRINAQTPQDFADILLSLALEKTQNIARDDCTVVVVKIID